MKTIQPDIPLPPGAVESCTWFPIGKPTGRVIFGVDRTLSDHEIGAQSTAYQLVDGGLEDSGVLIGDIQLNSDQARELASALIEAAAEADGWAAK